MGQSKSFPIMKLNIGEKDEMEIRGYRPNRWKLLACIVATILTCGVFLIVLTWRKDINLSLLCEECSLHDATKVLIKDCFKQFSKRDVCQENASKKTLPYSRYFYDKKIKYVWDAGSMRFVKFRPFDAGISCDMLHAAAGGLEAPVILEKENLYGTNFIQIVVLPVYKLILKEVSNPFYLFQFYTIVVWMAQKYFDYSAMVLAGTIMAVGSSVWETRKQSIALRKKFHVTGTVIVMRDGVEKIISTTCLVPGDLICIRPQETQSLHCDAVLIEGTCSVDESMLTGESYPITKISVPNDRMINFDYITHKRHVLFSGTQILQGRPEGDNVYLKAVVIRTGYMTSKGELIRAILHPKPIDLRFYSDLLKCAMLFLLFGLGGMIYSLYVWIRNGASIAEVILNSLDIITFVVPPMMPAALTATTSFAQRRLRKQKVFCLSSKHISMCGGLDVVCFDKTGTLTESDIDMAGIIPVEEGEFRHPIIETATLPDNNPLLRSTTICHSLILVGKELAGYSIDLKMFEATGWKLKEGPLGINEEYGVETPFLVSSPFWSDNRTSASNAVSEVAILKRFPFESSLKRMTVIALPRGAERYQVFVKGAPEIVASICNQQSIPLDYEGVLKHYTAQGYRVLALASKNLSPHLTWNGISAMNRDELEYQVELVGLLVLQNQLKKETLPNIRILHKAHINTVMVTGDNLQTAVKVAKDCEMISSSQRVIQVDATVVQSTWRAAQHLRVLYKDPLSQPQFIPGTASKLREVRNSKYCFALDGPTFEALRVNDPMLLEKIIHRAKVFARMAPENKQHLIETLQKLGRQVGMVGDGCNDCGALRAADAGISLSMADASVAAPFTSQDTNIGCVVPLIREGRTTLDCAFGTFQFAIGICFIFFAGVLMLYSISSEPSDFQYCIWDFGIVIVPFFTIGNTSPAEYLHPRRPLRRLWAFLPLFSLLTFVLWQAAVLVIGWFYCHAQPWFVPNVFTPGRMPPNPCYEETTLFFLMCIGSIVAAFVYAPSQPYSRHMFTNKIFTVWSVFATVLMLCVMFITDPGFVDWMNFKSPPYIEYTFVILTLGIAGGFTCYAWEKYVIREVLYQRAWPRLNTIRPARHMYQKIEMELEAKVDWPVVGDYEFDDADTEDDQNSIQDRNSLRTYDSKFLDTVQGSERNGEYSSAGVKATFRTFRQSKKHSYSINGAAKRYESPQEIIEILPFPTEPVPISAASTDYETSIDIEKIAERVLGELTTFEEFPSPMAEEECCEVDNNRTVIKNVFSENDDKISLQEFREESAVSAEAVKLLSYYIPSRNLFDANTSEA